MASVGRSGILRLPCRSGKLELTGPLGCFRTQCTRLWFRALRRRSQRARLNWDRMTEIADAWLPPARILHPWPEQRFAAIIQSRSRMQ